MASTTSKHDSRNSSSEAQPQGRFAYITYLDPVRGEIGWVELVGAQANVTPIEYSASLAEVLESQHELVAVVRAVGKIRRDNATLQIPLSEIGSKMQAEILVALVNEYWSQRNDGAFRHYFASEPALERYFGSEKGCTCGCGMAVLAVSIAAAGLLAFGVADARDNAVSDIRASHAQAVGDMARAARSTQNIPQKANAAPAKQAR